MRAGTFEIVAGLGEFAPARNGEDVCDCGIGRVGDWLALVKAAVAFVEGYGGGSRSARGVRPPGLAIVLHHGTTRSRGVIL
jgi:hypothetical protein